MTFGVWLLLVVVLTNGYIGLAISGLTAPLPFKTVETFEGLAGSMVCDNYVDCNQSLWWTTETKRDYRLILGPNGLEHKRVEEFWAIRDFDSDRDFRILSSPVRETDEKARGMENVHLVMAKPEDIDCKYTFGNALCLRAKEYKSVADRLGRIKIQQNGFKGVIYQQERLMGKENHTKAMTYQLSKFPFTSDEERVAFGLYNPTYVFPPIPSKLNLNISVGSQMEQEIVQCGRTAYVDRSENVANEYAYLSKHYEHITFVLGKDQLFSRIVAWRFREERNMSQYFATFISSGIYNKLSYFYIQRMYRSRANFTLANAAKSRMGW